MTRPNVVIRPPLRVTTKDARASNLMNALQILYMTGLNSQVDLARLNQHLSRSPGDHDSSGLDSQLLLANGLTLFEINSFDLESALKPDGGLEYWAEFLANDLRGSSPEHVRHLYQIWSAYGLSQLRVAREFASQITYVRRPGTAEDLHRLIELGRIVTVDESRGSGWGTQSIFYDLNSKGDYLTYSPLRGLRTISSQHDLNRFDLRLLLAWKR